MRDGRGKTRLDELVWKISVSAHTADAKVELSTIKFLNMVLRRFSEMLCFLLAWEHIRWHFQIPRDFLRRFRYFSAQKKPRGEMESP